MQMVPSTCKITPQLALGSLLVVRYKPGDAKTFVQMTFRRKALRATQSYLPG
jgi:hypothetical protein